MYQYLEYIKTIVNGSGHEPLTLLIVMAVKMVVVIYNNYAILLMAKHENRIRLHIIIAHESW